VLLLDHAHKMRGNRITIILDGADQLDSEYHGDMLHWLPFRSYTRFVVAMVFSVYVLSFSPRVLVGFLVDSEYHGDMLHF